MYLLLIDFTIADVIHGDFLCFRLFIFFFLTGRLFCLALMRMSSKIYNLYLNQVIDCL